MVYGLHGKVHLWPYINQTLLQLIMAENQNWLKTFSGRPPHQMSRKSAQSCRGVDTRSQTDGQI
jgi:hypothetical protein